MIMFKIEQAICLILFVEGIYGEEETWEYVKPTLTKDDIHRIRHFTPVCKPNPGEVCPPGTLPKLEGKSIEGEYSDSMKRTSFLKTHWVETYKNCNESTNIIVRSKRFPTTDDYNCISHFHLGRMDYAKYGKYKESSVIDPPNKQDCFCGHANNALFLKKEDKILGGNELPANLYPWLASMIYKIEGNHLCGATLINNLYVLTAAHCVEKLMPDDILIRLGCHRQNTYPDNLLPEEQIMEPQRFITHFRYTPISGNADIALIRFKKEAVYNDYVLPVCFPSSYSFDAYEGQTVKVPGWGVTDITSDEPTNTPKEATLKAMSRAVCVQNSDYPDSMIKIRNICGEPMGSDSCQGDSGGPMLAIPKAGKNTNTDRYHIIGIVSWGIGCNSTRYPGVYTKIQARQLMEFILVHTEDAKYCI